MKGRTDFMRILFRVSFSYNWGNGGRETNPNRHPDKNKTIPQRHGRQFGRTQISYHQIIDDTNERMTEHSQNYRISQFDVIGKLFGVL